MINNLGVFLGKFKKIENKNLVVRTLAKEVLKKYLLIDLGGKNIVFNKGVLRLRLSGPARAEVATQEKKIIEEINRLIGEKLVSKIV